MILKALLNLDSLQASCCLRFLSIVRYLKPPSMQGWLISFSSLPFSWSDVLRIRLTPGTIVIAPRCFVYGSVSTVL
jgi:hypothetical protein